MTKAKRTQQCPHGCGGRVMKGDTFCHICGRGFPGDKKAKKMRRDLSFLNDMKNPNFNIEMALKSLKDALTFDYSKGLVP